MVSCVNKRLPEYPSGLMVEFIREPENVPVLDMNPEFSWIVPVNAKVQTAYQIMVASSEVILKKSDSDIWDSKKIISNKSTEIEFAGKSLAENTTYFWKVRIWNDKDTPTEYSNIQTFTTGAAANYLTTRNKFQTSLVAPAKFVKTGDHYYFVDFGKDAFGTLILEINTDTEDTIIVHLGEKISEKTTIDRMPGGSIRYQRVLLPVHPGNKKYILDLPKDPRNTGNTAIHLPDSLGVITPFRYCELENCRSNLKAANINQKVLWYFFDDKMSSFTSSDTIMNSIWDICKYSIKATSFIGIYVDGDRERIPYEADAYINQLGHYYTDREYSLARLTNEYFIKHPTWPTEWILHTVPLFYYDFMYTGNLESVKNYYKELKEKTLISLAREDGLISSAKCTDEIMTKLGFSRANDRLKDIVDWPPSQKDTKWELATQLGERDGYDMVEINTVVNAFYFRGLIHMAYLAGKLGKREDSLYYNNLASGVKKSINEKLFNRSAGIYIDGESSVHSSLHANMIPLAFNIVPEENKKEVVDFIKSRGMACSVYGAQYLLEGLYRTEEAEYAFNLLTATNDRSWWNMIKSGSTITMEAWDMKYKPNSDWNHAWGAAPANIIPCYMWGIAPAEPGFAKATIKPQLGRLKNSRISVPSIRGNILAEFKDKGKLKEYIITIPANIDCDFVLTDTENSSVSINNKSVETDRKILRLNPGKNKIVLKQIINTIN